MNAPTLIHVAVGVIYRGGRVLLAKRAAHQHQGGLWEFPGGKVEHGEHVTHALKRELKEELAIDVTAMQPLIQIQHDYGDKAVLLDVWRVTDFAGEPRGQEGQPLVWSEIGQLENYTFPAANQPIVSAISLPAVIAITPSQGNRDEILSFCQRALLNGAQGLQLRSPHLCVEDIRWLQEELLQLTQLPVWVNSCHIFNAAGECDLEFCLRTKRIHFTATHIAYIKLANDKGLLDSTVSCHGIDELRLAESSGAKAVYLSPVLKTQTHPEVTPLGWSAFSALVREAKVPVYALGGMTQAELAIATSCYAQGIAGISLFQY